MLVRDVMTTPAITVRPDTPIKEALAMLDEHAVTALPVITGNGGQVVGVVSEADLIRDGIQPDFRQHLAFAPAETRMLPPHTVSEVMNAHPITVSPDTDLLEAVDLMTTTTVKSLPVVDRERRVVGVVSRRDVVHVLARPDYLLAAEADDLFRRLGLEWLVDVIDGVAAVRGPATARESTMATAVLGAIPGVTGVTIRTDEKRRRM
jgi:CBS domain-containing protein